MTTLSLRHPFGWLLWGVGALAMVYILGPLVVIVASSFGNTGYLAFPPRGFSLRWYGEALADPTYIDGFLVSLRLAGTVTIISSVAGVAAAFALVRGRFRGRATLEALFLSPLMLPGLVMAVALALFFSRHPWAAGTNRLILGHLVICIPAVMRVTLPVLRRFDRAIEEAALNLGASPIVAFFLVTLPAIRPGVAAGAAFAFILSFDEVEMAIFLSSPREAPLTVVLYGAAQLSFDPAIAAISALLVMVVFAAMLAVQLAAILRGGRRA